MNPRPTLNDRVAHSGGFSSLNRILGYRGGPIASIPTVEWPFQSVCDTGRLGPEASF